MDTNVDRLVKYASFGDTLSSALNDESFYSIPVNERGNYVAGLIEGFSKINNLNEDDKDYIGKLAEEQLTDFRISNNIPRFVPTQEQAAELFDRFPDTSTDERVEDVERKVDAWKASSLAKASALRPAEREDIETYLNRSSNNFIREEAARLNDTGWFMDKGYRAVEELAKPFHQLLDPDGSDRFWAKSAPENPSYDQDFTSAIAGGIGQVIPQIAISIGLTAAGSPEAIPAVFTALYGAEYMQNGYREEFARSGDEGKAWDNAVSQIPAALLETVGDMVLTKGVTKTARQFGKEFASASTMEAKKAILREALPTMGKAAKEGFIGEAFIGGAGADWASGYGSYLATGDESYLKTPSELFKGGLAEGIVGGLTAGLLHGVTNSSTRKAFAQDVSTLTGLKVKQEEIYAALKNGDFQKVIDITNKDIITDPAQQDATLDVVDKARAAINGKPITEEEKAATPKASSLVIPSTTRVKIRQDIENIDKELSDPSVTEERSNELNKRKQYLTDVNEKINNGTYEELNEVKGTVDTTSVYRNHEAIGKNDKGLTTQEITLDNGERFSYTTDDIPVFLQSNTFKQTLNGIVARFGQENVTVDLVATSGNAVIKWTEDGKKKHSQGFPYTRTPRKGFTPLTLNENGTLKIHNPINEIKYAGNARNIEVITDDTVNNIITVKNKKGETITLDGERANTLRASIPNYKPEEVAKEKAEDTKPKEKKASVVDNSAQEKLTFERGNVPIVADGERRFLHKETNKMGVVVKDNGTLLFKPDDNSTPIELGGAESQITLNDAGLTRELDVRTPTEVDTNDIVDILEHEQIQSEKQSKPTTTVDKKAATTPSSEKKQSHKTLISSLKEKLDQIHHDSIDRLSSISGIINKLISLGVEYKVMSSEEIAKEYGENNSPGFATSDGKIVFNLDALNATNKHDLLFKILAIHESAHAGIYIVAQQNPELYQAAKESVNNNPELISLAREEYGKDDNGNYRFDSMNQDGIFHETIRMIIEGRLTGRTTGLANSGPLKSFLQKLIDYIRNVMWRTSDRIVFQFVKNVENVMGITNSAIKIDNENITVNEIPANIVSDFVRIINGEDVDLENYKRDQLRDLADLMRIKRDRPDIKERLLSRIKEYKPISDSSNTNIINNSQPIIVGSDFFADSGKFYRVIQGDESLNDILQSGEVRTNAAEKIKSGMTLAEKMAARPTAFPSFSKGSASMSYAAENPNHSIIVTADKSLQPSTSGRHSAGKTHFPTVDGVHQKSLGNNFQVYKHIGNGEYELVFDKGMTGEIDNAPFSLAPRSQQDTEYLAAVEAGDMETAQRLVDEAIPPVKPSFERLWRAEPGIMDSEVPEWMVGTDEMHGIKDASGRWFYRTRKEADFHLANLDGASLSFVDLPSDEAEAFNAKNNSFAGSYGKAGNEYFVSRAVANKRVSIAPIIRDAQGNIIPLSQRFDSTNNNIQNSQPINLGDKFSFRLANELRNADDTFLGLKIANDRTLPTQSLIAKVRKSGITEFEVDSITNLINSLEDNGRVNISELSESIDNEPTLVINTLDYSGGSVSRRAELEHNFDTINPLWRDIVERGNNEEINSLPDSILNNLSEWMEVEETGRASATGSYGVDPYSNEVLSGAEIEPGHRLIWSGDLSLNIQIGSNPIIRQKQIDNFEQVNAFAHEAKFTSQHYNGDVAKNQLAFVRGGIHEYQKGNKLPDGTIAQDVTRIFEIWEVQSDWAGKGNKTGLVTEKELADAEKELLDSSEKYYKAVEDFEKTLAENKGKGIAQPSMKALNEAQDINAKAKAKFRGLQYKTLSSPLLKYWESLALKAAVNHAKKQGASNIIISDAETAMMTEGHDMVGGQWYVTPEGETEIWAGFYTLQEAENYKREQEAIRDVRLNITGGSDKISQEKGMRAAYDERIPNGLSKLSNSKGKKVTVGEHNKGPSKVFKNPDGTPKNTNTGLMFPVNNSVELQFSQPINLGDKFSFRLANELRNADDTFLGLKIANDRTLPVQNIIAKVSKSGVNEFEVETLTNLINSLDSNGRVNIDELSNLVDNEPTVVINTLNAFEDKSANIEAAQEYASLYHEAETKGYSAQEIYARTDGFDSLEESEKINISKEDQELFEKLRIAKKNQSVKNNEDIPATGRYGVDPYSNEQLKGTQEIEPGHRLIWSGDLSLNIPLSNDAKIGKDLINKSLNKNNYIIEKAFPIEEKEGKLEEFMAKYPEPRYVVTTSESSIFDENRTITVYVRDTKAKESPKFSSQHYQGEVADNQLAFVRGGIHEYQKGNVLPDGTIAKDTTRIFEIWEVQSDWDSRQKKETDARNRSRSPEASKEAVDKDIREVEELGTPLLKYWESLALKAAINHAKKEGASNIIISDAETAMMTEGHDAYLNPETSWEVTIPNEYLEDGELNKEIFTDKDDAEEYASRFSGATISDPIIFNPKPTQEKGMRAAYDERVPNGLSKLSGSKGKKVTVGEHNKGPSKVFKNPDGTPKNTNTGLMFPVNNNVELQFSQPITNEENTNEGESKPNENIIDEVVDSEYEHTDTVLGTPISPFRKTQIERLNKLRSVKIEALLSVEDKALFKSIKAIKALAALNDDVLAEYVTLYEDFVSTRSNNIDAGVSRPASSELINKLSSLTEKAKQAWFEEQKDTFPELAQKDFQKDFQGKMDYVNDFISKLSGMEETTGTDKVSKNKEAFLAKIDDLRAVVNENYDQMKEDLFSRMDLDFKESDNPHIQKGIELMRARMNDSKEWYGEFLNHLLNVDVIDMSAKNVRNTYYALMSVAYDGYVMNTDGFVSNSINDLLADSEGVVPLNTFTSTAAARVVPNLMSTSTKARSIVSNKGYIALQKIASNFRESLKQSHMMHELALVPYQKESIDNAQKKSGKRYSDSDLQRIGIYAISRRIRIGFDVKSEIERNISQIKDSLLVLSRSGDKKLRRASEWYNKYIDTLFDGVLKSETPIETLESNAVNAGIDDGMKGYVNDIVNFFDAFKPIAKFTKEFIYNREFIDEHNYVPTMILNLDESKGPLQYNTDDVTLNMTPEDTSERNVNTNGMSGTFDRSARLKENQALVFNINHLFSNRGRLNFLDAFSAVRRKEISTLLNAKTQKGQEMRDFLGDEFGGQFRYHTFIDFVKTQWKAEIESVQYIHQYQSVINGALSRWGGFALSSVYQGVMQLTSNIAPFMMANIGNPQKISAMFKAYDYMNRHRAGLLTPQQALIYEKVLFDVAHRHQDQVLDTSVNLGITQDGLWQAFKSSAIANGISKVDKIIDKVKFFQFRTADFLSGAPVMLAEYLDAEQKRLGAEMTFEDLVYDPGSYAIALDETERFIGIGNATRRGEWMTSRDAPITILRHMLTGFAGHRVNNATNFYVEMRKIANENISTEEKLKSASYVAGIISQSVIFSAGKVAIIYFLMSATKGILDGNDSDDDKVEELYRNRANAQTEKEKKLIDAEIAKRKQIRAVWKKAIDRQSDSYLFTMGLSKDIISNIFVSANLFEPIVDKLLYFPIDEHEEKMFKELKAKRTEALESKIKNAKSLGDTGSLVELQRQLADTQASEFLRMTHPSFGNIIPYGGMYGGVSRNLEKVFDASLNPDTLTLNDVSNMAAAFGWNLADVSRITRIMESVDDAKLEAEKKKRRLNGN